MVMAQQNARAILSAYKRGSYSGRGLEGTSFQYLGGAREGKIN